MKIISFFLLANAFNLNMIVTWSDSMSQKDKEILDAIEYSLFMSPGVEGVIDKYKHESLKGYICPMVDFEELNRVGMSRLPEDQTEETIKEVIASYSSLGLKSIGWILSPQSEPSDLKEKLENSGFKNEIPILGMVRPLSEQLDIEITDEFEFKSFKHEKIAELIQSPEIQKVYEKAYGAPEGSGQLFNLIGSMFLGLDYTVYVAYEKDNNKPVAFGSLLSIPNSNCALLSGAATLPEYRKKGIYSAFLKMRYNQAKIEGVEYLIVQAKEGTSAPIAAKNGFEKVCELPFYVWRAEESE